MFTRCIKLSIISMLISFFPAAVAHAEMQEGLTGDRAIGRFGWNLSGKQVLEDGLLFNKVDENGIEACIGLGNNKFRKWRMDIGTPGALTKKVPVKVKWLNWIAKEVEVRRNFQNYNLIYSLASPGIIIDTTADKLNLRLRTDKIRYFAYQGKEGIVINEVSNDVDGISGNMLKANWILCFSGEKAKRRDVPILLVLSKSPASILIKNRVIKLSGDIGKAIICLPFGLKTFIGEETEVWGKALPAEVVKKCSFWSKALLKYPVNCKEFYEVDEDNQTVRIQDRYEYLDIKDAWHTKPQVVAPLPPIVSFARTEEYFKDHIKVNDKIEDLGYPTWYGPLEGNIGKATVTYNLPCPYSKRIIPLRVPGKSPFTEFLVKGISKKMLDAELGGFEHYADLSMFLWMDSEVRDEILAAGENKIKEFFKYFDRHCVFYKEPSTGKGFFLGTKALAGKGKDSGSFRIDGERAFDMTAWTAQYLAPIYDNVMWSGNRQILENNWEKIKRMFDTWWVTNDWAIMSASEADSGGVAMNAVDCTWDALSGLEAMMGMARLIGDNSYAQSVQYLWARQMPASMLKLALQWNYLPKYLYTFEENEFFMGIGELDSRYSPKIPYMICNVKVKEDEGRTIYHKAGYTPRLLPMLFNNATIVWSGNGSYMLLSEMAPTTTRKYIQKIDEFCPDLDNGTRRIPFRRKGYKTWWKEVDKHWEPGFYVDQNDASIFDNHLFLLALLRDNDALKRLANTFYRSTFQEQISFKAEHVLREFLRTHRLHKVAVLAGYLHSPVSLGEWGTYKVIDGYFLSDTAKINFESRDKSLLKLRLVCRQYPESISVNNIDLKRARTIKKWHRSKSGWFYGSGSLWIKSENQPKITVVINFTSFKNTEDPFKAAAEMEQDNLVYNPGFEISKSLMSHEVSGYEDGDVIFNRWESALPISYYGGIVSSSNEFSRSGEVAAKLILDKETCILQDVKGIPGKIYKAAFYYYAPDFSPDKDLLKFSLFAIKGGRISQPLAEENIVISQMKDKPDWEKVSLSLTCPQEANIIRVQAQYQPRERYEQDKKMAVYIDDVSLTITGADTVFVRKPSAKAIRADDPRLIFYASFDKGLDANFARGDGKAGVEAGLEAIVDNGHFGRCLSLTKGMVSYYAANNFKVEEGTLSLWIKPDRDFFEETCGFVWGGCVFWTEFNFIDYHRFTVSVYVPGDKRKTFTPHFETECGISPSGERPSFRHSGYNCEDWDKWHHIAVTWKKKGSGNDQTKFYFDGVLIKTINDATLAPVVKGTMKLGHIDPHKQFVGLIDELKIYDKVLADEEIKKLYRNE